MSAAYPLTEDEQLVEQFVNREQQLGTFEKLLGPGSKIAMSLAGKSGMGKSWLIARMIHECSLKNITAVRISWVGDGIHDYIGVMRQCRDALDAKHFGRFTDRLNYYTVPEYKLTIDANNIEVARDAQIEGSTIGVMAAVNIGEIYIRDRYESEVRRDLSIPEAERREALSARFLEGLKQVKNRVVFFFDGIELMSPQTQEWLWSRFVAGVVNQRLLNFRFVISGQIEATPDISRKPLVVFSAIEPLKYEHVVVYLKRRGIREEEIQSTAKTMMRIFKGRPYDIAAAVAEILDAYEQEAASGQ